MRDERKEFKVRLTAEEWEEVRQFLFTTNRKQQEAGHAALFALIRGAVPSAEQAVAQTGKTKQPTAATSRHAEWHRLLDIILDQGTPEDVTGIQANLKWGAGAVEGRAASSGPRAKRKAG